MLRRMVAPHWADSACLAGGVRCKEASLMPRNLSELSDDELENLVENHRKLYATDRAAYAGALRELEQRKGRGLDFDKSFAMIRQAASEGRFLSYKDLADASGADWGQVHYAV